MIICGFLLFFCVGFGFALETEERVVAWLQTSMMSLCIWIFGTRPLAVLIKSCLQVNGQTCKRSKSCFLCFHCCSCICNERHKFKQEEKEEEEKEEKEEEEKEKERKRQKKMTKRKEKGEKERRQQMHAEESEQSHDSITLEMSSIMVDRSDQHVRPKKKFQKYTRKQKKMNAVRNSMGVAKDNRSGQMTNERKETTEEKEKKKKETKIERLEKHLAKNIEKDLLNKHNSAIVKSSKIAVALQSPRLEQQGRRRSIAEAETEEVLTF